MSESKQASASEYALETQALPEVAAPELPYRPPKPKGSYRIGLIGCGGISRAHLEAYKAAGFEVVALADRTLEKAKKRRDEFYPNASVTTDVNAMIARDDLDVLDITPHPEHRGPLIRAALESGKHVLSQKPFVTDIDEGEILCDLADARGLRLAVNQNGRWAPHLAYMREAVRAGIIGNLISAHISIHWDHTWTAGTAFENVEDLVMDDFGIHWFDFVSSLIGRAERVQASRSFAASQTMRIPMLSQAIIEFEGGQASLIFDAHLRHGPLDQTYIGGSKGSLICTGPDLAQQTVTLYTEAGKAIPKLEGRWFNDGFAGAMGELLCAIEENRSPLNNARDNLRSLELCFAAIAASRDGTAKRPGEVRRLE